MSELAHEIAVAVRRCPDVADLSGGPFGTVATYLPGERVSGVAVRDGDVEISIVAQLGRPLPEIAEEVRTAVASLVGDRPVNVHIGGIQ
ncbi:putative alkaline shock family protein YloU [Streptosporangium album]|uniref:Putative alkaline shock family protein YloU n=1 Tax=Streptosporangium album TaxID=47479 RepID=A0A7W7W8E6_9ACTN|nr:Asp23/Gls24 family envelope stress response protein [Streptosporangium album]MBB4937019.1 putative alkaline shock family protein YloU [Streptosporangium album]